MLSIENQKHLLNIAHLYKEVAVLSIRDDTILDDEYEKPECIDVIENNDFKKYSSMDTFIRETMMENLMDAFCFIDPDTLWKLSEIVVDRIEDNNRACSTLHNRDAILCIQRENDRLKEINTMLIRYSRTLNPDNK